MRASGKGGKPPDTRPCFVYVLGTLAGGRHLTYVGWTHNVARRLTQHNDGKGAKTTRGRAWTLLHSERCANRGRP
jgi:putative endonuclease